MVQTATALERQGRRGAGRVPGRHPAAEGRRADTEGEEEQGVTPIEGQGRLHPLKEAAAEVAPQ
jgi:hypothetical protein